MSFTLSPEQSAARAYFPRGLHQPQHSFRFSADALLLAAFIRPGHGDRLLDLGTGCGVVALAALLLHEGCTALGIDIQPELVTAACHNARLLGLETRFEAREGDWTRLPLPAPCTESSEGAMPPARPRQDQRDRAGAFDLVTVNPPYRLPGQGRTPREMARRLALFEEPGSLRACCACAARFLAPEGRLACIFPLQRRLDILSLLAEAGLSPLRTRIIYSSPDPNLAAPQRKGFFLVEAGFAPHQGCVAEPDLTLHPVPSSSTPTRRFSLEAVEFCPFLNT